MKDNKLLTPGVSREDVIKAREDSRRSIIAKLACLHGGHNASENSWGD